jgi:uncharacterized RDD family membrane protein YckC
MSQTNLPPPEWRPDPSGRHQYRLWDGASWTARVADDDSDESIDQPPPPPTTRASRLGSGPNDPKGKGAGLPPEGPGSLGGIGRRFLGSLIDCLVVGAVIGVISRVVSPPHYFTQRDPVTGANHVHVVVNQLPAGVSLLLTLLAAIYTIALIATRGQTLGEMAVNLRVIERTDGGVPGWEVAARRWLLPGLCGIVFMLSAPGGNAAALLVLVDYLWALWDPNRQCLHDKLADTLVVRTT